MMNSSHKFCDSVALWAATTTTTPISSADQQEKKYRQTFYEIKLSYFSFKKGIKC